MLKFQFFSVRTKTIFFKNNIGDHSLFMPGGGLARLRGGPCQIQDSQKGGVINKSAHKGLGGYLIFYFCFIFKQILSVLLGLTVHGLQASQRLTVQNWQFKANKENSHNFY